MNFIFTFCMLFLMTTANAQDSLEGVWNTGNDNTKIEISEVDGVYEGKILSSDNEKAKIGKVLLKDLKPEGETWKGKIFAAKRGSWMDAVLKVEGDQLIVTVGQGWKSKTIKWKKE